MNIDVSSPLTIAGTYVRTSGIDRIVETFLGSGPGRKQIVSLGAGSDTRYFRLKQNHINIDLVYHEIDFEANTKIKIKQIEGDSFTQRVRQLCSVDTAKFEISNGHLTSPNYYVHGHDLRNMPEHLTGLDPSLPSLVISECCLIYLSPVEAETVLKYFTDMLSEAPLALAIYEPIRPNDSFGKTMVRNLITRGIHLQTLEKFAELENQRQRLQDHGFESQAEDINFIWRHWVEEKEKERVDSLEWMDEIEEFVLLAKHYCIAWGWRGWTQDSSWGSLPTSKQ